VSLVKVPLSKGGLKGIFNRLAQKTPNPLYKKGQQIAKLRLMISSPNLPIRCFNRRCSIRTAVIPVAVVICEGPQRQDTTSTSVYGSSLTKTV